MNVPRDKKSKRLWNVALKKGSNEDISLEIYMAWVEPSKDLTRNLRDMGFITCPMCNEDRDMGIIWYVVFFFRMHTAPMKFLSYMYTQRPELWMITCRSCIVSSSSKWYNTTSHPSTFFCAEIQRPSELFQGQKIQEGTMGRKKVGVQANNVYIYIRNEMWPYPERNLVLEKTLALYK